MKKLSLVFIALFVTALTASASAQLELEWQGPPGTGVIGNMRVLVGGFFDANGDGTADLPILDMKMGRSRLLIVSGSNRSTQWIYPLGFELDGKEIPLMAEVVGDGGLKEAVVVRRKGNSLIGVLEGGKVKIESGVVLLGEQYVLMGIADYDDDGENELLLGDMNAPAIELWGTGD